MVDTVKNYYEVASENGALHWWVSLDRLEFSTGLETNPAAVLSDTDGIQATGTILSIMDSSDCAVIDFTPTMVYRQNVRNVKTYNTGSEATWGTIAEGDVIYYDRSATMPADCHLSTSPLDSTGAANPIFGMRVKEEPDDACAAVGATNAGSTNYIAVMQLGIASLLSL